MLCMSTVRAGGAVAEGDEAAADRESGRRDRKRGYEWLCVPTFLSLIILVLPIVLYEHGRAAPSLAVWPGPTNYRSCLGLLENFSLEVNFNENSTEAQDAVKEFADWLVQDGLSHGAATPILLMRGATGWELDGNKLDPVSTLNALNPLNAINPLNELNALNELTAGALTPENLACCRALSHTARLSQHRHAIAMCSGHRHDKEPAAAKISFLVGRRSRSQIRG